jgi:hypothetical protein
LPSVRSQRPCGCHSAKRENNFSSQEIDRHMPPRWRIISG